MLKNDGTVSFARTAKPISKPPFVVDDHSIMRDTGRQVDWSLLTDQFRHNAFAVVVGAAGAAQGATAVPVAALDRALEKGTVLHFSASKLATLSADVAAGAVSLPVEALVNALV